MMTGVRVRQVYIGYGINSKHWTNHLMGDEDQLAGSYSSIPEFPFLGILFQICLLDRSFILRHICLLLFRGDYN